MKVSVITPVYQAEHFLAEAVESALQQTEVCEVILVEDGSTDNSWDVAKKLAGESDRVTLLTHPNHENRGAGASRNLGMRVAKGNWLSFLDADDFMLRNRFAELVDVVENFPDTEGVYEAVGFHFSSEETEKKFWARPGAVKANLTTVESADIPPRKAFFQMAPIGDQGYGHTDGWTIRKTLVEKAGEFNPNLRLHQDTDFFMRCCLAGVVRAGSVREAVAMRRVHGNNRITAERSEWQTAWDKLMMFDSTWQWANRQKLGDACDALRERACATIPSNWDLRKQAAFFEEWMDEFGKGVLQLDRWLGFQHSVFQERCRLLESKLSRQSERVLKACERADRFRDMYLGIEQSRTWRWTRSIRALLSRQGTDK